MDLEPKSTRDLIGIDSYERAIVYSSLLLRSGYLNNGGKNEAGQFNLSLEDDLNNDPEFGNIAIQSSLFYNNLVAIDQGGDVYNNIEALAGSPVYSGSNLFASQFTTAPITPDPIPTPTLEQYLYFSLQQLLLADFANLSDLIEIRPSFAGNTNITNLQVKASIRYHRETFLVYNNLIQAVGVNFVPTAVIPTALVGNTLQFGNNFRVGNSP